MADAASKRAASRAARLESDRIRKANARARARANRPFPRKCKRYPFDGQLLTRKEISSITGLDLRTISKRLANGVPLEQPRKTKATPKRRPPSIVRDDLPYADDLRARHMLRYMLEREPLTSEEEIRELFPNCSAAEARGLRRYLSYWMRLSRGGWVATLDELAEVHGISRQGAEFGLARALENFRAAAKRLQLEEKVISDLRELIRLRKETYAERMEAMAEDDLWLVPAPPRIAERFGSVAPPLRKAG